MTSLLNDYDVSDVSHEIIQEMTDGIIVTTMDGKILYKDEQLKPLFIQNGTTTSNAFFDQLLPGVSEIFHQHHLRIKEGQASATFDVKSPESKGKLYKVKAFLKSEKVTYVFWDKTLEGNVRSAFEDNYKSIQLMYDMATDVIEEQNPKKLLDLLFDRLAEELNLDTYFNYLIDPDRGKMRLTNYKGIPGHTAEEMEWLTMGQAVCGTVAQQKQSMIVEGVQQSPSPLVGLIRSLGISCYACYPLVSFGEIIGTLSFGSLSRRSFTSKELDMLEQLALHVSKSMERWQLLKELKETNVNRQKLNQQLMVQQERLANIFEGAIDGIMITDQRFKMIEINKAGAELLGIQDEGLLPLYYKKFIAEDHQNLVLDYAAELEETGQVIGEINVQRLDGKERIFGFSGVHSINPNQNLIMFRDITRQKLIEKKIIEAKQEAVNANNVKTDFLLQMSHDFRTPLNTVIGYSELLEPGMERAMTEKETYRIRKIGDAGRELLDKVNHVLTHTRKEFEHRRLSEPCFLATTVMNKVYHHLAPEAEALKVNFILSFESIEDVLVCGEEEVLFLSLKELVRNSIKHNGMGGVAALTGYERDGRIFIEIRDKGKGISCDIVEQIHHLRGQKEVRKEAMRDLGLGLSLALRMLKELNADLSMESVVDEGTSITVSLPIHSSGSA